MERGEDVGVERRGRRGAGRKELSRGGGREEGGGEGRRW